MSSWDHNSTAISFRTDPSFLSPNLETNESIGVLGDQGLAARVETKIRQEYPQNVNA